jgi:hypothetical protein
MGQKRSIKIKITVHRRSVYMDQAVAFGQHGKHACKRDHRGRGSMPTISQFFGIVIQMFWREHAPPHFHALYAEHEALIDIRTLEVIGGSLPRRALSLTLEWANEHRAELMEDWTLCQAKQLPKRIKPLE